MIETMSNHCKCFCRRLRRVLSEYDLEFVEMNNSIVSLVFGVVIILFGINLLHLPQSLNVILGVSALVFGVLQFVASVNDRRKYRRIASFSFFLFWLFIFLFQLTESSNLWVLTVTLFTTISQAFTYIRLVFDFT